MAITSRDELRALQEPLKDFDAADTVTDPHRS